MNPNIHWITFHGSVDSGYLLKAVLGTNTIPANEKIFFDMMRAYFVNFYDVK